MSQVAVGNAAEFFVKPGYRTNAPCTLDATETRQYWTGRRLKLNSSYQYYVYLWAQSLLVNNPRAKFMDVGSGPARKVRDLIASHCSDITLIDQANSESLAMEAVPNARFLAADLERIDTDLGERFDVIVCADVLEHVHDPTPCADFVRAHLAPNGVALLSTPERDIVRGRHATQSGNKVHVREWNRREFAAFLESRGFKLLQHANMPQMRLSAIEHRLSKAAEPLVRMARWHGCQVVSAR
jgi:SAM-dependent methyltransferase